MARWRRTGYLGRAGTGLAIVGLAMTGLAMTGLAARGAASGEQGEANGALAFQREVMAGDHTQVDIWTVAADGTGAVRLTRTPQLNEFGPIWNRAGDQLAFWRTPAPFGTGSLWVMAGNGSAKRRLTDDVDARDPSWNPAGTRLVYDVASHDLWTLRVADGRGRRRLTSGAALDFEPAWSPAGARVAFTRASPTGDPGDLYVIRVGDQALTRVTRSAAYDHQVTWGPAGHRLVFERDFADHSSIFSIRADGTDLRRLTAGRHFDVGPGSSPDGSLIAFGSDRSDLLDDLWVMNSDGTGAHQLFGFTGSAEAFPDWQPGP